MWPFTKTMQPSRPFTKTNEYDSTGQEKLRNQCSLVFGFKKLNIISIERLEMGRAGEYTSIEILSRK